MENLIENLPNYWDLAVKVLGNLVLVATPIALITPSKKDDKIVTKAQKVGHVADQLGVAIKPLFSFIKEQFSKK